MRLARVNTDSGVRVGIVRNDRIAPIIDAISLFELLEAANPQSVLADLELGDEIAFANVDLLPPIDAQEVWAAGVTYKRSKTARMEESDAAASCYDRVYQAARPEIFFKATPHRVRGHGQSLRIRVDSKWNVPEPEVALVITTKGKIVGYTIGNDMSSRDIEGENPLYLPQAKCYDQSCGLGPWITLAQAMPNRKDIIIRMTVSRERQEVFSGETSVGSMARGFEELVEWLWRDNSFPNGAILLTGTGIVPDSDFTLQPDDIVEVSIDGIGVLSNSIICG